MHGRFVRSASRRHVFFRWLGLFGCLLFVSVWFGCPSPPPPPAPDGVQKDAGGGTDATPTDTAPPPGCLSDADCTDSTKPKCINGTCDAVPSGCSSDADCTDPTKPTCINGSCQGTCACASDSDCPPNHTCTNCQCQPNPPQCTKNDDCKAGFICDASGNCVPQPGCKDDTDCTDPSKPKCDTATGKCVPGGCKDSADCAAGEVCKAGKCEPSTPSCRSDDDCKDPNNPKCFNGQCVAATPGCSKDSDCPPSSPKCDTTTGICESIKCQSDADCKAPNKCVSGQCGPECRSDADCKAPGKGKCTNGQCTAECAANSDCKDPQRPICQAGTCTPKQGCKSDRDCATSTAGKFCALSTGKCVACLVNTQCKDFQICDVKTYTCVLKPGSCASDKDCSGTTPYCVNNTCSTCRTNADCKRLESCLGGVCKLTGCTSDADCAADPNNKYCNATSKKCVTCTLDSHCPAGNFCDTATSVCQKKPACAANKDCKPPLPYCDYTSKVCVVCNADNQCKKDPNASVAAKCTNNTCAGCAQDKDCNLGFLCKSGACVPGCNSNRDCPSNANICSQTLKKCVECAANSDCSGNDVCDLKTNKCSYRCTTPNNYDRGCAQRGLPRYCDGTTRTCVSCVPVPFSSTSNIDRGCNNALPKCDATTKTCVICRQDSDCPVSGGATKATCDVANKRCVDCKTTNDCRRGYVCNTQAGKCTKGCLSDNDCPRGKVCGDSNQCVDCSTKNPTCAAGLYCKAKEGQCVACLTDTHCKSGEKCDTSINLCLGNSNRAQCSPCTKDSECATNHTCVKTRVDNGNIKSEQVCLQKCSRNSDCGRGYTCCSSNNSLCNTRFYPERSGRCFPAYTRAGSQTEGYASWISCRAVLTQGQACTLIGFAASCGVGPVGSTSNARGDSLCDANQKVCRLPCRTNDNCISGYTCQCPPGLTNRNSFCYDGNRYVGPQRCVK